MLKKTAKKNAFNNKLMSLALATGITAQAVPFTTNLLPSITQNVLAHADDNQSENFSYTLQTKDESGKVVVSDKITFTKNDDGTYKVTDEAGLLKPNTNNVKIDDMMNIQLNNLIDSTKELNWISQNGQYKLADNHESATPDDQGNLTFAVVKNTTNKDNGGSSDSTAPTTPTDDKDHNQSGSDSSNTTPAKPTDDNKGNDQSGSSSTTPTKPTDNNKGNEQSGSKDNQEQSVVYHLNLVNDGKTVKTDTITFTPKGDGSYTVKDDAGLAITSDYTPAKDAKGVLTFDLNSALNSGLINWINDGTWQLDGSQSIQTSGQDVNYKVVKADGNHQDDSTNIVLNLVNSANNKVVKTDTFTFTPTGEDGHYLVTDTAGLAPAVNYVAQKVDGKYNFDINSIVSANTLGGWVNDGTWTLDSNKQEGTKGKDGSLNFYVTHAKTDAGYLQSFKEKYPSDKYGIVNQNGSTFTFVQFDPSTKQVTYMGTIDMSQADPQATKLNDGTTSYTRTFTRTIYGLFDGEKRQITAQSAEMTVTQHTTFVGDNQPLKTNLTYSQAKFDAYKPTVVPNGYKLVKEVDVPETNIDQSTPSLSSAEQMSEYQSVNTDSGSGSNSNSGTPGSGNPSSDSSSSTPDSGQTSSGSSSTPGSGDSNSGSSSTPTKPDSGSGSSSTPTKPDSGSSDSSSTPTKPDSGSGSSSTPTTPDSGSGSGSAPTTPTTPDSGSGSTSTPTKPDSDSGSSSTPTTPTKPSSSSDQSSSASSSTPTNPSSGSSASSTPSSNTSSAAPSSSASSNVNSGASSLASSHASSSTGSSASSKASSNTNSNTSSHASSATNSKTSANTSSHATSGASSKVNSSASSASANSSAPNSQSTTLPSEAAAKFNSMPTTSSNGTINPLAQTNARNNGNQELALSMLGGSIVIGGLGLGLLNKRKEE